MKSSFDTSLTRHTTTRALVGLLLALLPLLPLRRCGALGWERNEGANTTGTPLGPGRSGVLRFCRTDLLSLEPVIEEIW